jgi:Na+-transporting methylmalonyl-CoA/oxaloacetate decarboxylase gamma subunit
MLLIMSVLIFLVVAVEFISKVNSPAEARVKIDSDKFHPEFRHVRDRGDRC